MAKYVRFVIHRKDDDSGKRQGIFQALFEAEEEGLLYDYQLARMKEIMAWFNANLAWPHRLSRSSKPHAFNKAISWFKDSAADHITHMRELAAILEDHDITVDVIQTDRPGFVVYEDRHQVAAEPFKDSGA